MDAFKTLHVQLLGNFHLVYGDETITGVKTTRLQALLAYLILNRNLPQPRQRLAFAFWPDTPEEQARNNLRNLFYFLRRALPERENFLLSDTQTIQWNPQASFALDVEQFNHFATHLESKVELQQAIQLYSGDLLPDCYDDWIQPERENLRQLFIRALERLIQLLGDEREYSLAITYAQRLLQVEPLSEEAHRQLMRLYAANGDRAKALHIYHTCVTLLERELGVEPGLGIQNTYQRLLKSEDRPSIPRLAGTPPLIGRGREWAILQSCWRNAANRQAHFALIMGEAGIGKSRLAEEMIDWAGRQGIPTAMAQCFAAGGELSYGPVATLLRHQPLPNLEKLWLGEVARILPELLIEHPELSPPAPLTENWQRLRFFKALSFALLKGRSELILLIEDLNWSDRDTIEWIAYLLQGQSEIAANTRLLVIATLRAEDFSDNPPLETLLADLRRGGRITEIGLEPLNEEETIALAGAVIGDESNPAGLERLFQETEGNPLFVVEIARAGISENLGWANNLVPEAAPSHQLLPDKVRQVVEARLGGLSSIAQDLAGIAATAGRAFSYNILSLASEYREEQLVSALDELWRRRIIREHGSDAYDFSHDKIRLVTYQQMSPARLRFCHHKVAEALEKLHETDLESNSAQIADHYERAGLPGKAIAYYLLAAQRAQGLYANQQAIQLLQRGLRLLDSAGSIGLPATWIKEKQGELFELQGDILARIGDYVEACQNHLRALALVDGEDHFWQARLQRKIGNDYRESFNYDQAVNAYEMAQVAIDQATQDDVRAWRWEWIEVQLDHSLVNFYLSREDEVLRIVERLRPVIDRSGTIPQRGRYYRRLVTIKFRQKRFAVDDETIDLSRKALDTIKESDDLVEIASAHFGLGLALMCCGDLDEAEAQMQAAVELTRQTGQNLLPVCYAYLGVVYRKRGDREAALAYARRVLEITTMERDPIYFAIATGTLAWAAWRQRLLAGSEQQARQALAIWQNLPDAFPFRWVALWPLLGSTLSQSRLVDAIEAARALFGPYQHLPPSELSAILTTAIQAWDNGQPTDATLLLNQACQLATDSGYL